MRTVIELDKRADSRSATSDTEWRKHLASNGFKFPPSRSLRYQLTLPAGPDDPAVEHELRMFLKIIEDEFQQCMAVLSTCSKRWNDFNLPASIDRRGIKPNGYKYGNYQFTLEKQQILDLLMGENLYEDRYVFIRELLQNAIDTSRHREFIEHAGGNLQFRAGPVEVSEWEDTEGHRWIEIVDFGMGMNEQIIEDFLLKVGRSYYASSQFTAELLKSRNKQNQNFMPISRFGIGLLSCFLVGDRVEILSVRRSENGSPEKPVRLSLNGLHGFYTLQTPPLPLNRMPAADAKGRINYNRALGTTIAVRLDPKKEEGPLNLKAELERYLLCPPIQVKYEGQFIGSSFEILQKPLTRKRRITIPKTQLESFERKLGYRFKEAIEVELLPLDLTKHSPSSELRGQVVVARFVASQEWKRLAAMPKYLVMKGRIWCHEGEVTLRLEATLPNYTGCLEVCRNKTIRKIVEHISETSSDRQRLEASSWIQITNLVDKTCFRSEMLGTNPKWLVHNGIVVPTRLPRRSVDDGLSWGDDLLWFSSASLLSLEGMWGIVALNDSLRPNISLSRDLLLDLPFHVHSAISLAAVRARRSFSNDFTFDVLNHFTTADRNVLGTILSDPLVASDEGWKKEPIFKTLSGYQTLEQITAATRSGLDVELLNVAPRRRNSEFGTIIQTIAAALAQKELCIEFQKHLFSTAFVAIPGKPGAIEAGHELFPPLTLIPFKAKKMILHKDGVLNADHAFAKWLLKAAPTLNCKYPGIFRSIREAICEGSLDRINENLARLRTLSAEVRPPKVSAAEFK